MRETNVIEVLSTAQTAGIDAATAAIEKESAAALRLAASSNTTGAAQNTVAAASNQAAAAFDTGAAAANTAAAADNALAAAANTVAASSNTAAAALNTTAASANNAGAAANSASASMGGLGSSLNGLSGLSRGVGGLGSVLQMASQGTGGLSSAIGGLSGTSVMAASGVGAVVLGVSALGAASLSGAGEMERYQTQFGVLLGSTEKAKDRLAELTQFAAATPFEIPEVVRASKVLQTFGGDALATGDSLRIVGDVASGTGRPFEEMALLMGRVKVMLEQGLVPGDQLIQLQGMGALTTEGKKKIDAYAAAVRDGAASGSDAWKVFSSQFTTYSGMMEKQSATFEGKLSNLQDAIGGVFRSIGFVILPVAKAVLDAIIPVVNGIGSFIGQIGKAQPATDGFGKIMNALSVGLKIVGDVLGPVISFIGNAMPFAFEMALVPLKLAVEVIGFMIDAVSALYQFSKPALDAIGQAFTAVFGGITDLVRTVVMAILDAGQTIVGVAASIPGPWQDGANAMAESLTKMKSDVASWGMETTTSAKAASEDAAAAPAAAMNAAVAPTNAAAQGVGNAMTAPVKAAAKEIETTAGDAATGIASSIRGGRTKVTSATDALMEAFKTAIDPMKEAARLEGLLAGTKLADALDSGSPKVRKAAKSQYDAMVREFEDPETKPSRKAQLEAELTATNIERGLRSKNPEIRAAAEAAKAQIEDRLFALRNSVGQVAIDTGTNYATAFQNTSQKTRDAVNAHTKWVKNMELADEAKRWGRSTGNEYAAGLSGTAARTTTASREIANAVRHILEAKSPPGPASPLHEIGSWGARTIEAWADGVQRGFVDAAYSARNGAAGVASVLAGIRMPGVDVGQMGAIGVGGIGGAGGGVMIGEINVVLPDSWRGSPQETHDVAEALAREIRLTSVGSSLPATGRMG